MTSLEHCFMLEVRSRLNFATMLAIYKSGFTRCAPCALFHEIALSIPKANALQML